MFLLKIFGNEFFIYQKFIKNQRYKIFKTYSTNLKQGKIIENKPPEKIEKIIKNNKNKLLYNSVAEFYYPQLNYIKKKVMEQEVTKWQNKQKQARAFPESLKYVMEDYVNIENKNKSTVVITDKENVIDFPYRNPNSNINNVEELKQNDDTIELEDNFENSDRKNKNLASNNWLSDYEFYPEEENEYETESWGFNYGTANPNSVVSNVPCGGCGSLLHCKDTAIPGFLPKEIFENAKNLHSLLCQRCHFLKYYDTALQVRVSPDDYPKILSTISNKKALAIIMLDLTDFPCSIWPNIINIIGVRRPVIIVGNKIDLLPQDSKGYLDRIKKNLEKFVKQSSGISRANIKHVALISAKTGFGVEELITKLHSLWLAKGDVYILGCTNVGKSTLFNTLLQSDYCKVQAVDLIQRATTSQWPGTTLNLLKFPILRPSGWKLHLRESRLSSERRNKQKEEHLRRLQLHSTQNPKFSTLMGYIGRTFTPESLENNSLDPFSMNTSNYSKGSKPFGIDENSKTFKLSKWCFDTPGVVQPDQILHLLTTEELTLTIPNTVIRPRTFLLKPGHTILIAGLARLDFVEINDSRGLVRFTVFASMKLPITVCNTADVDELYKELLGTELFSVPKGPDERLNKWPHLKSNNEIIQCDGIHSNESCLDIVLSSAGWISVAPSKNISCKLKAWTPDARGIYIRNPLLPFAVSLRRAKIRDNVAYKLSKFF